MNPRLARSVAAHTLGWLAAANGVGVLMAALLVWPSFNRWLAPFTYGRWAPLHLNWELYGPCALPLVGILCRWILAPDDGRANRGARIALLFWTLALAGGGVAWLAGVTSGKLFLDWHGWARPLFPAAAAFLWCGLSYGLLGRRSELTRRDWQWRALVVGVLAAVPPVMFAAESPSTYPSVNPDSGGATGASLLGSTLIIVAIGGWLPHGLGLARTASAARANRWYWWTLAASAGVYAAADHGHASHHAGGQILSLGSLLLWGPLCWIYFRSFVWPTAARPWLAAGGVWWMLLLMDGWWNFLPGISERFKFSDLLVAHAHLAMAGVVTSIGMAILTALGRPPGGGRCSFWLWQMGLSLHLAVLVVMAFRETADSEVFFAGTGWVQETLVIRLGAGAAMWVASLIWLL